MQVAFLLRRVKVPDYVVWQTVDLVTGDFGQFCKPFRFDLVVYWFCGEVDAWFISRELVLEGEENEEYLYDGLLLVREG